MPVAISFPLCRGVKLTTGFGVPHPVNLNHFRLLRVVGRGAFGKVRIVERKDTSLSFALKYIRKDEGSYQHGHTTCQPGCILNNNPPPQLSGLKASATSYGNVECSST